MILLRSLEPTYAQEQVSVPVVITLEAVSALETTAQPTLDIHTSKLDVVTGDSGMFLVSLSSMPAGPVPVSSRVIDVPPGGIPDDLILSSLSLTPTDYSKNVTVTAVSDAKAGEYAIELISITGEVTDTKTIVVTVKEAFEFLSISDVKMPAGDKRRRYVQLRLTGEFGRGTIPVTVSIRENVGNRLRVEPTTLIFTEENYDTPQPITVIAADNAVPGKYTLVANSSRDGYNDVSEQSKIEIFLNSCGTAITTKELNFGAWAKPSHGVSGVVDLKLLEDFPDESTMTSVVVEGVEKSFGEYVLSPTGCGMCIVAVTYGFKLRGATPGGQLIDFSLDVEEKRPGVSSVTPRRGISVGFNRIFFVDPSGSEYILKFGGRLTGINFNTREDTYRGTISIQSSCR